MEFEEMTLPIYRIWRDTYWGELGMVAFRSTAFPGLVLLTYLEWARENGYNLLVIDVLDALREYTAQLPLLGIDQEKYSEVRVLKVGGRYDIGNVIKRIPTIEEKTVERELASFLTTEYKEKTATAVVGFSKPLALYSKKEAVSLLDFILGFVGNEERKTFYFVNLDILENALPIVLPMIKAMCTTIVDIIREPGKQGIKVEKALNFDLEGFSAEMPLEEMVNYLR
jgi:hypothetical protein